MHKLIRAIRRFDLGIKLIILTLLLLAWSYREVIAGRKIIFPSNFLAQFYSPWATQTFPGWEQGIPHKPIGTDQLRFFYPGRTFTNERFANKELPLWNPYIFSGNPHAADVQSAVWYPLNALYAVLPQLHAWQVLVVLQPILALLFMYLYLRRITADPVASWVGGIAFGLSSFMTVWSNENMSVGHAALWLPFILWGVETAVEKNNARYLAVAAGGIAMSILAGFFQITVYMVALVSLYAFGRYRAEGYGVRASLIAAGFMICAGAGIAAIALVPSFEAYVQSPRGSTDVSYLFDTYLVPITHLVLFLSPDIFGSPGAYNFFGRGFYHETVVSVGLVPVLFALFAMTKLRRDWYGRFFTVSFILTFILTLANPVTRALLLLPIPLISTFLPSRILFLTAFSASVLAALGFRHWYRDKKAFPWQLFVAPLILLIFSVALAAGLRYAPRSGVVQWVAEYAIGTPTVKADVPTVIIRNSLLALALMASFFAMTRKIVPHQIRVLAALFMIAGMQLYGFHKYRVVGDYEFLYPEHPVLQKLQGDPLSRFMAFGYPVVPNLTMEYGMYSPEGLNPIFSKRYGELVYAAMHGGALSRSIPRIEVSLSELTGRETITQNVTRLRLLSLLGVGHIAYHSPPGTEDAIPPGQKFPADQFLSVGSHDGWSMYKNLRAFPRAMLIHEYEVVADDAGLLRLMFSDAVDLSKTVMLEKPPSGITVAKPAVSNTSKAMITTYSPNRVEVSTHADADGLLLLTDTYYPGWKAEVDGIPADIYRADYAFRAVAVPSGEHRVVFRYMPLSFVLGASATAVSALGLLWWLVKRRV